MLGFGTKLCLLCTGCLFHCMLHRSHAQQQPQLFLEKFSYPENTTFRTNVCERQRWLVDNTTRLEDSLRGLNLSVAITNYRVANEDAFFTLQDGRIKTENPGLFVVILDEVARRAGFEWRNAFAAVAPLNATTDGDRTWTDILLWEVEHFDISVEYWFHSHERMGRGISFPYGWYDASGVIAFHQIVQKDAVLIWSFLLPFDGKVWMAILAAIFFTGIMYFILERLNTASDERELEDKPLLSIFLASLTFTGHFEHKPTTNAARLMSFSWTFWALVLASAYTANLASFLLLRNEPPKSVNTLNDVNRNELPLCLQRSTVMDEIVSRRYPTINVVRKSTEQEIFEGLRNDWYDGSGGCGAAFTSLGALNIYQHQEDVNWDCVLTSKKRTILNIPAGFASSSQVDGMCTSLISHALNVHLYAMARDGFIERAWQAHLDKFSTIECHEDTREVTTDFENPSLLLKDVAGIFIVHGCLTAIAVLFGVTGRLRNGRRDKSKESDMLPAPQETSQQGFRRASIRPSLSPIHESSSRPFDEFDDDEIEEN